jgi:hypothetical protein
MKTVLITLIAAIALTHAADARDWAWFRGDIGIGASPFVSSSSPTKNVTTQVATKKKPASNRAVVGRKSKSTGHRITAR